MFAVLTGLMTGQAPEARSGDEPERRVGYVDFQDVVAAIRLANEPIRDQIQHLTQTLREEVRTQTSALGKRFDDHEAESHQRDKRIAELEKWRQQEEVDEAFRRGFWHVVVMLFRWSTDHPAFMAALGATIVGIIWVLVAGGLALYARRQRAKAAHQDQIFRTGIKGTATVLAAGSHATVNDMPLMSLQLDLDIPGVGVRQVRHREVMPVFTAQRMRPGLVLPAYFDPNNPADFILVW
jgi:hypothetical protein